MQIAKNLKKEKIILRFNRKIYSERAIEEAKHIYSSFANIILKKNDKYFNLRLYNIAEDYKEIIADEFANSVLMFTKVPSI